MKRTFTLLFLTLIATFSVLAQSVTVTGTILDENDDPMVGVNVVEKGTTNGTSTNLDGKYTLNTEAGKTIVFKFIGYADSEKVVATGQNSQIISVRLFPSAFDIGQVVVSASKRKERILDAPASVTVIGSEKIAETPATTAADHMKSVPGVDVMETGIVSSNIAVRGFNNIFSTSVLTMVDNRIAGVPSLKVNAYQLIPTTNADIDKIELVRGPGSALYGPNASDGVLHIITKSPLAQKEKLKVTVSYMGGIGNLDRDSIDAIPNRVETTPVHVFGPELLISAKLSEKVGLKGSWSYTQGKDWQYYDVREPAIGDGLVFGNVNNGNVFAPDTAQRFDNDMDGVTDSAAFESGTFDRNFDVQKFSGDLRLDFAVNKDFDITLSGGVSQTTNLELTGLGGAQGESWRYWNAQARFRYKSLFAQYYVNSSNAGDTYLLPQVNGAAGPHNISYLVDKSKMHVAQIQHNATLANDKLDLTYGFDALMVRPETGGTIHGRYEDNDNTNQYGLYAQGEYKITDKFTALAALRGDYHDVIEEFQISPRAALVFKPTARHTTRLTYNRAFSSPSSLNLFLDLANGAHPLGFSIRGSGNPNGYNYNYDANGVPRYISHYDGQWYDYNDKSYNSTAFANQVAIISAGLVDLVDPSLAALVPSLVSSLLSGIEGPGGTIDGVSHMGVDFVSLLETGDVYQSEFDPVGITDLKNIESTVTQTVEIGYKGIIKDKLFLTADAYYSKIDNFVSPLTNIVPFIAFDQNSLIGALENPDAGVSLAANLAPLAGLVTPLLDGNPSYGNNGVANGSAYDELVFIILNANAQLGLGNAAPQDSLIGNDIALAYVNLGTVDVTGLDIGANYVVNDDFSITGSFSMVNKDRIALQGAAGGFVALNAPKFKGGLGADYSLSKQGVKLGATWRWQDAFPANSAVYVGPVKAANFLDVRMSYRPNFSKNTLFSLNVSNVLNYEHQRFPGTPAIGRFAMAKLTHTFSSKK